MKRLLTLVAFFATLQASAQQVNPVPDYVFANRMSAGRNTVTDTAAYFSIGPRYGATRGMMPPMVVDTASFSANKRNGLLIFSVQKNKFIYWDSVGVKWAEMAGTGGSAITGSGVAGYMPEFTTATNIDTTRLYHSAGRFAIGSTTTSNGVFNVYGGQSYLDTSLKVGSQTLLADEAKNEVYVNTTSDNGAYALQVGGSIYNTTGAVLAANSGAVGVGIVPAGWVDAKVVQLGQVASIGGFADLVLDLNFNTYYDGISTKYLVSSREAYRYRQLYNPSGGHIFEIAPSGTANANVTFTRALTINPSAETIINTTTDAGDYKLQVSGSIYNTANAILAVTSGSVGIGLTSPTEKIEVAGNGIFGRGNNSSYYVQIGTGRTNNGAAFIDLIGDATYTEYGLRIVRNNAGPNTSSSVAHRGTGPLQIFCADSAAITFVNKSIESGRFNETGELLLNSGNTDNGNYKLQVDGNVYLTGSITTGAPSGGSIKPWKIGEAATVSPTSPNRTIRVEIDGVVYYLHAKTTND